MADDALCFELLLLLLPSFFIMMIWKMVISCQPVNATLKIVITIEIASS